MRFSYGTVSCRAISAAAPVHRAAGFDRSCHAASGHSLLHVAELTCACIAHGGLAEDNEGMWAADAADLLLEAWVELLADDSFSPRARLCPKHGVTCLLG